MNFTRQITPFAFVWTNERAVFDCDSNAPPGQKLRFVFPVCGELCLSFLFEIKLCRSEGVISFFIVSIIFPIILAPRRILLARNSG
jgi:hypothetical protein